MIFQNIRTGAGGLLPSFFKKRFNLEHFLEVAILNFIIHWDLVHLEEHTANLGACGWIVASLDFQYEAIPQNGYLHLTILYSKMSLSS